MIAGGKPLPDTLDTLLRGLEAQSPEWRGSILLLDADGGHLRHGAAPSLPVEYVKAIDGAAIAAFDARFKLESILPAPAEKCSEERCSLPKNHPGLHLLK